MSYFLYVLDALELAFVLLCILALIHAKPIIYTQKKHALHAEPPTFHLIFSYYTLINSVLFKPFPYVHGYTLYHMHEKGWGWMLPNP